MLVCFLVLRTLCSMIPTSAKFGDKAIVIEKIENSHAPTKGDGTLLVNASRGGDFSVVFMMVELKLLELMGREI